MADVSPEQYAHWCATYWEWLLVVASLLALTVALGVWRCARSTLATRTSVLIAAPLLAMALFAWLACLQGQVPTQEAALIRFDVALAAALQKDLTFDTLKMWVVITHGGDGVTRALIGVAMVIVLYRQQSRWLVPWILAVSGIGLLNHLLKGVFERVRPLRAHDLIIETSWSFPSGHASGALVTYGMLVVVLMQWVPRSWHAALVSVAALLVLNIGLSRVLLQVHYFSDVLAGFAIGIVWLTLCAVIGLASRRVQKIK